MLEIAKRPRKDLHLQSFSSKENVCMFHSWGKFCLKKLSSLLNGLLNFLGIVEKLGIAPKYLAVILSSFLFLIKILFLGGRGRILTYKLLLDNSSVCMFDS